jgi:hypothetical protein
LYYKYVLSIKTFPNYRLAKVCFEASSINHCPKKGNCAKDSRNLRSP